MRKLIITCRTDNVSGILKTNGQVRDPKEFHKASCYLTQDDLIPANLDVNELMKFAANVKLSQDVSEEKKQNIIDTILTDLSLFEQKFTRTECLSGGQTKRLSIALELINNPPIFLLDEPTSGLDDVSTYYCIRLLRKLARQGRTIVCTVHQPSAKLISMFDHAYVVARGKCVYQGDVDALVPFLASVEMDCPLTYNPFDYIIEQTENDSSLSNVSKLSIKIANGKISNKIDNTVSESGENSGEPRRLSEYKIDETVYKAISYKLNENNDKSLIISMDYPISKWLQFYFLICRMTKQLMRNKVALWVQLFTCILCSTAIGTMYYDNSSDAEQVFAYAKLCIAIVVVLSYAQILVPIVTLPYEVKLVRKEIFNRWYAYTPYYLAHFLARLPLQIGLNVLYLSIIYYMTSLPHEWFRYLLFVLIGCLVSMVADAVGFVCGSLFNITNGITVGVTSLAPCLILSAYGIETPYSVHPYMLFIMNCSYMRLGVIGFLLSFFGYERETFDCNEIFCYFQEPEKALIYTGTQDISFFTEAGLLFLMFILFRTLSYFTLQQRFAASKLYKNSLALIQIVKSYIFYM